MTERHSASMGREPSDSVLEEEEEEEADDDEQE